MASLTLGILVNLAFIFYYIKIEKTIPSIKRKDNTNFQVKSVRSSAALISISEDGVNPDTVHLKAVNSVKWENNDTKPHRIIAAYGTEQDGNLKIMFDSEIIVPGDSFIYTFNKPGTFAYYDSESELIKGTVIVED
jgi:plastocyanin